MALMQACSSPHSESDVHPTVVKDLTGRHVPSFPPAYPSGQMQIIVLTGTESTTLQVAGERQGRRT